MPKARKILSETSSNSESSDLSERLFRIAEPLKQPEGTFGIEKRGKVKPITMVVIPIGVLTQIALQLEDIAAEIEK
tara:strand:- start:1687 stop:1914 length:228 start_codon:yes stop_codon:yes gene_type:complete